MSSEHPPIPPEKPIADVLALCETALERATPGEWQTRFLHRVFREARKSKELCFNAPPEDDWAECELIVLAINHLPRLIRELKSATYDIESYRQANERLLNIVDEGDKDRDSLRAKLEAQRQALHTAKNALRSFQYGNNNQQFAKDIADAIDTLGTAAIAKEGK